MGSFDVELAELRIANTYGDEVSVKNKAKTLLKFGRNEDLGTSQETIWTLGGHETLPTTNAIDTISSSDAGDDGVIRIEGHTVSGTGVDSQFTFVVQTATLNGQSKVTLGTPLARVSRVYEDDGLALAGTVQVYEDTAISGGLPSDATKAHIEIDGAGGNTQSLKGATTFSNLDYALITGLTVSVAKKQQGSVDFVLEIQLPGKVFRPVQRVTLTSSAQSAMTIPFAPHVIVPKNSDVRVVATGSTTGMEVDASFNSYLAQVRG